MVWGPCWFSLYPIESTKEGKGRLTTLEHLKEVFTKLIPGAHGDE